jgi:transposase InsO family protein
MKYQFIDTYRSEFAVERMCRALKVSKSGYYAWGIRPQSKRARENEKLDHHIKTIYRKNKGTYGSPRITKALNRQNIACSENRVARRMRINDIKAKTKKRFKVTTNSKHNHPVAKNLLDQNFKAQRPNQVWASDITYIWTREGWMYLAVIVDLFGRHIVGWAMDNHLGQELVVNALKQAIWRRRPPKGVIFHSDQGVQYACQAFRKLLQQHKFIQSMSGKGNCYDNAVVESFFHTLKTELIYFENYRTREDAKNSIFEYIEVYYNRDRMHSTLNYYSPVQFEQMWINTQAA